MASNKQLIVYLLTAVHKDGTLHREGLLAELGRHIKPEKGLRTCLSFKHNKHKPVPTGKDAEKAIRIGKRRIALAALHWVKRSGFVVIDKDSRLSLTKLGVEKLINTRPQVVTLPPLAEPCLFSVVDTIKIRISSTRCLNSHINRGLLEALRIIHRVARE